MRKFLLFVVSVVATAALMAEPKVYVVKKDGSEIAIPLSELDSIRFENGDEDDVECLTVGLDDLIFEYIANDHYDGLTEELMPELAINDVQEKYKDTIRHITVPCIVESSGVTVEVNSIMGLGECKSLVSVDIPRSLNTIYGIMFADCINLKTVRVSSENEHFRSIDGAVYTKDMTGLVVCPGGEKGSAVIPASVVNIDDYAFRGFVNLKSISVASDNKRYTSIDGILYSKDKTRLIACPAGIEGSVVIPSSVKEIEDDAFWNCIYIESVVIPESVVKIGSDAFSTCVGLKVAVVPKGIEIPDGAFSSDTKITRY